MAVGWLRGFFSSAPVLGILRFLPRALELRKSFWGGLCFPVRFGEQQAAERGHRLYPGFFFLTTEAVSSVWIVSGFWKHLIYKGRAERLHRGISTVSSITRTWHLSFPPMSSLSFCWSLKLCRITFYFQLFPLFLHTSSTSCPVLIPVPLTFSGIFPHSLSLYLTVLILSLWNPNSPFASHLLFFTSIIIYQVLNYTGVKIITKGIKLYPYYD